jgi:1-acyl-sn-glycerol-3-phosphate acyltransferase
MDALWFQNQIRENGSYKTAGKPPKLFLPSPIATPLFGVAMAGIYVMGNIYSKRPGFMNKEWAAFGLLVLRLIERLGGRVEIEGFEHIKNIGSPVVWASNHVSSLETYLLPPILMSWPGLIVVLKESLARYPLFGSVVRAVDPIRVQRENPIEDLRKVLTDGVAGIKAGRSALIFPQGARYRSFDPKTFNSMASKLALRAGAPLVPLAVSTDFLRIGKLHRDLTATTHPSSPVRISCGPVLPPSLSQAEMQRQTLDFITAKLSEWGEIDSLPLLKS